MTWVLWCLLLIIQNFAFTMVSRARNSKSIGYHAIASIFSNGIWFASQFILVDMFLRVIKNADWQLAIIGSVVYVSCTMTGSLTSHWFLMKVIEPRVEKKESW